MFSLYITSINVASIPDIFQKIGHRTIRPLCNPTTVSSIKGHICLQLCVEVKHLLLFPQWSGRGLNGYTVDWKQREKIQSRCRHIHLLMPTCAPLAHMPEMEMLQQKSPGSELRLFLCIWYLWNMHAGNENIHRAVARRRVYAEVWVSVHLRRVLTHVWKVCEGYEVFFFPH